MSDAGPDQNADGGADQQGVGGSSGIACPDMFGPISVVVTSFPSSTINSNMAWRVGDTQPSITIALTDGNGDTINLSDATSVDISFSISTLNTEVQTSALIVASDGMSATYERQPGDPTTTTAGWYNAYIFVSYAQGTGFSAPTNGCITLFVKTPFS
jgi:hypothetical protein